MSSSGPSLRACCAGRRSARRAVGGTGRQGGRSL